MHRRQPPAATGGRLRLWPKLDTWGIRSISNGYAAPAPPPPRPPPPLPSPPVPSSLRRFFRTWRREIVRGGALFVVVVAVGLAVSRARVGFGVPWQVFRGFQGFDIDFDSDLFGAGRSIGDRWEWRGEVKPGQQLWVRNTNGPVEVLPGTGNLVEVIGEKSWRHSDS